MGIPSEAAQLYIEKVVANTFANPAKALTGPLVRKDAETVQVNLRALTADPNTPRADEIYKSFLKTYWPEYLDKHTQEGKDL